MIKLPDLPPQSLVAVDTETSGLFVDDGARVSIVSIAWYPGGGTPGNPNFVTGKTGLDELDALPCTAVYCFDQGRETPLGPKDFSGIPFKKQPQPSLFDDNIDAAPNLLPADYYRLMDWLSDKALVFHNSKFDLHILTQGLRGHEAHRSQIPDLSREVVWDTQVCNPVLWPEFATSLKPTSQRLWGEQEADLQKALHTWLKKNGYRFDLAPWSLVGPYAAKDAEQTLRLYDVQQLVIDSGEMGSPTVVRTVCDREIDLAITLFRMEQRGIGLDADGMLDEAEKIAGLIEQAESDLRAAMNEALDTDRYKMGTLSEHTMRHFWFGREDDGGLGNFPVEVTEKGTASVSHDVVRVLAERGVPAAREYERLNSLSTAHSMWFNSWPRMAGDPAPSWHPELINRENGDDYRHPRLRTNYRQSRTHQEKGGTISGRLAVERVQLQAIPQDYQMPDGVQSVRSFFRPDPGYELWEIDLSQAEYRVAAGISKCKSLIERFEAGDDAHSATCRLMFKIDESHPDWDQRRAVAKRLNFGMLYGAGAQTTRNQIKIYTGMDVPLEELEKWLAQYRSTFPELGRQSRYTQRVVERSRALTLAGGRQRWFSPMEFEHKAFNQLIQGGVAEMMKEAMIEVEANLPGVLLLQIHDSMILELLADRALDTVEQVKQIMCDIFAQEFNAPFKADAKRWGAK